MSNVSEIRDSSFDVLKLQEYLSTFGFAAPLTIKQFSHGQSNPTMQIVTGDNKTYVLRKQPPGSIMSKSAHRVDREARIMKTLYNTNVPVPEILLFCDDESIIGKPFYVCEFCNGRIFKKPILEGINDKNQRRECWYSFMKTLAELHEVDYKKVGLSDYGKPSKFFSRTIKTYQKIASIQSGISDKVPKIDNFDYMAQVLEKYQPNDWTGITHGDYKIDNVIFSANESKVISLIDWELSTLGHYGNDIGSALAPLCASEEKDIELPSFQSISKEEMQSLDLPKGEELLKYYCECRNNPDIKFECELKYLYYYLTFYWWKSAVILQGVAARSVKGQASSAMAETIGAYTTSMAKIAFLYTNKLEKLFESSKL